jgi:hypothetical protein
MLGSLGSAVYAQQPTPAPYRVAWEFDVKWSKPVRTVVYNVPGKTTPQVYWYLPFTVTNNTDQERLFTPVAEIAMRDGRIIRADRDIPGAVVEQIRKEQGNKFIETTLGAAGQLRIGPDQAKSVVAIWAEPQLRMGDFSILIAGLNGEYKHVKDADGKEVILRKTLQLDYKVVGDEIEANKDQVLELRSLWIMR